MHSRLFFVVLALFVLSSAEELETQYDLSPPSQAEFAAAEESLKSEIWPQRDDEYGSIGGKSQLMEIQLALADESSSERNVPLNGKGVRIFPINVICKQLFRSSETLHDVFSKVFFSSEKARFSSALFIFLFNLGVVGVRYIFAVVWLNEF